MNERAQVRDGSSRQITRVLGSWHFQHHLHAPQARYHQKAHRSGRFSQPWSHLPTLAPMKAELRCPHPLLLQNEARVMSCRLHAHPALGSALARVHRSSTAHAHAHTRTRTCTRTHTHTQTHTHARTHTQKCTDTYMCAHTRVHTHVNTHAHTYIHERRRMHANTCKHARTHSHKGAHKHSCVHTNTHAHTHSDTRTCTHAHAHVRACRLCAHSMRATHRVLLEAHGVLAPIAGGAAHAPDLAQARLRFGPSHKHLEGVVQVVQLGVERGRQLGARGAAAQRLPVR